MKNQLRIITGLAGTGKTARIMDEIRQAVLSEKGNRFLIVPEQYSHEAERELCAVCGDTMSLYAEVLSFSALARHLNAGRLSGNRPLLDKGGRFLCMALAAENCADRLPLLGKKLCRPEMLRLLCLETERLKAAGVSPEQISEASAACTGALGQKLADLACVCEAYEGIISGAYADPSDALKELAALISSGSAISPDSVIYIDGFTDFTRSELEVISALLRSGAEITVCLTLDSPESTNELFAIQRSAYLMLRKIAGDLGVDFLADPETAQDPAKETSPIRFLAENIFSYTGRSAESQGAVELFSSATVSEECSFAAEKVLELIRDHGARRRDIAIAVRGYEDYAPILESVFEEYGIPLFTARKESLSAKPLPLLIASSYRIVLNGWRPDDVLSCLGTELCGLPREESDLLSEYIYRWDIGAALWHSSGNWTRNPEGYGAEFRDQTTRELEAVNSARRCFAGPLLALERSVSSAGTAREQIEALYDYLNGLKIARLLDERAQRQSWDITVKALEQAYAILGELPMSAERFAELFVNMLSAYDTGAIPISLDAVSAGDLNRMRRRNIKNLIILGASSERIPLFSGNSSVFSESELEELETIGSEIGENRENALWREYSLIYHCLSLPSEHLILSSPRVDANGNETRPSFIFGRAEKLFGIQAKIYDPCGDIPGALLPAVRLALSGRGACAASLSSYFEEEYPGLLEKPRDAASASRGSLSPSSAVSLYGVHPGISASKAESFFSCRYRFFTGYGLNVRPFRKHDFTAADVGTFTHYVLQHTAEEIMSSGGFSAASDELVTAAARKYIQKYETEELKGLEDRTSRFRYLFRRVAEDTVTVALDMAGELRSSLFEPAAFELNLSGMSPLTLSEEDPQQCARLTGIVDRADIWKKADKTYLRIADYKTGNKTFSVSDIWYGLSMQLILYLYALCTNSEEVSAALHLSEQVSFSPAGVMYVPASSKYVTMDSPDSDDAAIAAERHKKLKRSGIMVNADGIPDAWEINGGTSYSPLKQKGSSGGNGTVTPEQIGLLYSLVRKRLLQMASEIVSGSLTADPVSSGGRTACDSCDMNGICGFYDGESGESFRCKISYKWDEIWNMIGEELDNV